MKKLICLLLLGISAPALAEQLDGLAVAGKGSDCATMRKETLQSAENLNRVQEVPVSRVVFRNSGSAGANEVR